MATSEARLGIFPSFFLDVCLDVSPSAAEAILSLPLKSGNVASILCQFFPPLATYLSICGHEEPFLLVTIVLGQCYISFP